MNGQREVRLDCRVILMTSQHYGDGRFDGYLSIRRADSVDVVLQEPTPSEQEGSHPSYRP